MSNLLSQARGLTALLACLPCLAYASEPAPGLPPVFAGPTGEPMWLGAAASPLEDDGRLAAVAGLFEGSGMLGARARCEDVSWREMQPEPGGPVDFSRLDAFVRAHQARGISQLLICLDTGPSVSEARGELGVPSAIPPAAEFDAYAGWVAATVERYDADGVADMPGLEGALRYYEVGAAFARRPGQPIEPYLHLLGLAHRAAHEAYRDVMVLPAALLLATRPGEPAPPRIGVLEAADRARLLAHPERFDALNLQVLVDAGSLDVYLAELAAAMTLEGYRKPIVLSHVGPSPLVAWGRATSCEPAPDLGLVVPPAAEEDRCAWAAHFRRLVSLDPEALAWTWRFAAADLVKKSVVAASHGAVAGFVGPVEDSAWWQAGDFQAATGITAWSGLVDAETRRRRPAHVAMTQLAEAVTGARQVTRVDMGRRDVRLYAFTGRDGPVWVGWHEPEALAAPGQAEDGVEIEFDAGSSTLGLTSMAEVGGTLRPPQSLPALGTRVRIRLTREPIYLRSLTATAQTAR